MIDWRYRPAETVIQNFSDVVKDVVFDAREFGGTFTINPHSHLIHRLLRNGEYEPRISSLFFSFLKPDADILDVGANIGFFTVGGALRLSTGRVFAAEPTPEAFRRLSGNVERNGVRDRVILFKGLIGPAKGEATINFVPGMEEYSSINQIEHFATKGQDIQSETVPIDTVDSIVEQHGLSPALIKVDVEGAEFAVFQGAKETLVKHRPVVIAEIWAKPNCPGGQTGRDLVRVFHDLGYDVYDPHDRLCEPGIQEIGEMVCIPKERADEIMMPW